MGDRGGGARGWAANELKAGALVRLLRAGDAAGVPLLPVKGVLTSRLYYPDPRERPMVDVDVRVRPSDLERLRAAAATEGWATLERSRAYASCAFDVAGERVEVETTIGPPGVCAITVDAMLSRATAHTAPFGAPHLQPEVHDHALVMIVNAFKDRLSKASDGGYRDLSAMAGSAGFSFTTLGARAGEGRVRTITWLVAQWMVEQRGDTSFRALQDALAGSVTRRSLYARALRAVEGGAADGGALRNLASRVLVRAGSDSVRSRARALVAMAAWASEQGAVAPRSLWDRAWRP